MTSFLLEKLQYNKYHLFAFGFVATLAHPTFWAWWTYIYPNPYESIAMRTIGVISCILLLFLTFKENKCKNFLKFYWLFIVIYNLPFFFTVNLIKNGLIDVWLMEEIVMIFVVLLFIPNIFLAITSLFIGVSSAVIFCLATNTSPIYPIELLGEHSLQYALALVAGYIFNYSNVMGVRDLEKSKAVERSKTLKSLGGSIAHEMRNPLGSIHQSTHIITKRLKQISESKEEVSKVILSEKELEEIQGLLEIIGHSATRGNMVIDMILSNLKENKIDNSKFKTYKISDTINTSIKEFAFDSPSEKRKSINKY